MKTFIAILLLSFLFISCKENPPQQQKSDSGVEKATVKIKTDQNGHTAEQYNIIMKNTKDSEVGAVKHLYIVSSQTGDVLEYSTVRGKVSSGGKRLSPKTVIGYDQLTSTSVNYVNLGNKTFTTNEVPDEYGTYGDSMPYVYWEDAQGNYHQYFPSGGTYLHISEKPLRVKKASMTFSIN